MSKSLEELKKKLEGEKEEMANRAWGFEGTSIREAGYYKRGHEAATNILLPLLEKAVDILSQINIDNPSFEDSRIEWMELQIDKSLAEEIREFLAEIKKESGK